MSWNKSSNYAIVCLQVTRFRPLVLLISKPQCLCMCLCGLTKVENAERTQRLVRKKYFSVLSCRKTLSVTRYCYMKERDECAGKGMVIARTDTCKWNKTERWGIETEVRKSVYHKLRYLNYNFKARHLRLGFLYSLTLR